MCKAVRAIFASVKYTLQTEVKGFKRTELWEDHFFHKIC